MAKSPITRAVEKIGTQAEFAKATGFAPAFVWQWVNNKRPVPAKHCIAIELATGITRYELRPDVFGPAPTSAKKAA